MPEAAPAGNPMPWRVVIAICALQIGLNLLAVSDPQRIEIDPEERYNAAVAWMVAEGNLDAIFAMQYRPFCGGCTADALAAAALFTVLPRALVVYKLVPITLSALVLAAGLRLLRPLGRPAVWAWAALCLLPPRAGLHLSLIAWGNHTEAGALVALALLCLHLARRPMTAGFAYGLGLWVSFSGAFGLLAAALGPRSGPRPLVRLAAGMAIGLFPWLIFALATGQNPISSVYGDDDAVPVLGRVPHKLLTLFAPRQVQALLGMPDGAAGLALGLCVGLSALAAIASLPVATTGALRAASPLARGLRLTLASYLVIYSLVRFQIDMPASPAIAVPGAVRYAAPLYPLLALAWALAFGRWWAAGRRPLALALIAAPLAAGLAARAELRPQWGPWTQAAPDWAHARQQLAYAVPIERHLAPPGVDPATRAVHAYGAARERLGDRLRDPRHPPLGPLLLPDLLPTPAVLDGIGDALAAHTQDQARPLAALLSEAEAQLATALPDLNAAERARALRAAAAWRLPSAIEPELASGDQPITAFAAVVPADRPAIADAMAWAHGRRRALELAGWHHPRPLPVPALDPLPASAQHAWTLGFGCGLGERWGPRPDLGQTLGPGLDPVRLAQGQADCAWPGWLHASPPPAGPARTW